MLCNCYLGKNHKTANYSTTSKAGEKISAYLESLEIYKYLINVSQNLGTMKFYFIKLATDFSTDNQSG
jgi:hypothetical protein